MSSRTLLPLYHIYVEAEEQFSWLDCEETISKKLTGNCNLFAMVNDEFENIQNALASSHEDISHINAQVTELFFVAIPSQHFTFRDFIKFAKIDLNEIVGSVRTINPFTKQHSICIKFQNIQNAQKCFLRCHGKRYLHKNDICHVLFAVKFEIVQSSELIHRFKQMHEYKYLQLPLCPSCLERLDPTVSNVWPHYCDEVENASFYNQITSIPSSAPSSIHQSVESSPRRLITDDSTHEETQPTSQNSIVGIENDPLPDFVSENHYTATSAGVCRCVSRWTRIECPVCNKINEMTRKQRENETADDEIENKEQVVITKKKKHKNKKKRKRKKKKTENDDDDETKYNKENENERPCCQQINELWICLVCGHLGCGRFKQSHALQHYVKSAHSFCVNLVTLSVWDYSNDLWQHRLFQKRTFTNEMQRERQRIKQQQFTEEHATPGGPVGQINDNENDTNHNSNNNVLQPMDGYSRATVMAKLENVREYYNRLLLDVIQQQSQWGDQQMRQIKKENEVKCNAKRKVIDRLNKESGKCDKTKEAIELWSKIEEMRLKNLLKKKEFQQIVNKTRQHKKELDAMKEKYDLEEQRLREHKNKQKEVVQKQIDMALAAMTHVQ
eukprot:345145_1